MKIEKQINGDEWVIHLEGRLDTATSPALEEELSDLTGVRSLVLDFEKLDYLSSAGLRILLIVQKTMMKQGGLVLRHVNSDIMDVFEITGFASILNIE